MAGRKRRCKTLLSPLSHSRIQLTPIKISEVRVQTPPSCSRLISTQPAIFFESTSFEFQVSPVTPPLLSNSRLQVEFLLGSYIPAVIHTLKPIASNLPCSHVPHNRTTEYSSRAKPLLSIGQIHSISLHVKSPNNPVRVYIITLTLRTHLISQRASLLSQNRKF